MLDELASSAHSSELRVGGCHGDHESFVVELVDLVKVIGGSLKWDQGVRESFWELRRLLTNLLNQGLKIRSLQSNDFKVRLSPRCVSDSCDILASGLEDQVALDVLEEEVAHGNSSSSKGGLSALITKLKNCTFDCREF